MVTKEVDGRYGYNMQDGICKIPSSFRRDCGRGRELKGRGIHLVIKDCGLASAGRRNQVLINDSKNVIADFRKLLFDLVSVIFDALYVLLIPLALLLLLDGGHDPP